MIMDKLIFILLFILAIATGIGGTLMHTMLFSAGCIGVIIRAMLRRRG